MDIKNKRLFFDGAMGTMLEIKGFPTGVPTELANIQNREDVVDIHQKFITAGCDIITTNTFGANSYKLKKESITVSEIVQKAISNAKEAIAKSSQSKKIYIAQDIGPTGRMMTPIGDMNFEEAYELFKEQVLAGSEEADLFIIETFSNIRELKACILAVKENSKLPLIVSMTFDETLRTLSGTDPKSMVNIVQNLGVDALGVNCSLGPDKLDVVVDEILEYASIPVIVQANAGLPKEVDGKTVFPMGVEEYTSFVKQMAEKGVSILGGCCGTTPEYIASLVKNISSIEIPAHKNTNKPLVSSSSTTVELGRDINIIGERINPTGRKLIKEALRKKDFDTLIEEGLKQERAGAKILDVNFGIPDIDEAEFLKEFVDEFQDLTQAPLCIDSSEPKAIEKAVRIYGGRPIINSVNGKNDSMDAIFPIASKYGALVIALCMDENGIPKSDKERVSIAEKIIIKAKEYGIPEESLIIDTLVLTVSAEQDQCLHTLSAIRILKEKYNVNFTLGASNISFGLPERKVINSHFLTMAMGVGLNTPILNPMNKEVMNSYYSYRLLANIDKGGEEYIQFQDSVKGTVETKEKVNKTESLEKMIEHGLKDKVKAEVIHLLKTVEPMDIVNGKIIPALDIVGELYDQQKIYLPQLIKSANAVKAAFECIKLKIASNSNEELADKENNNKILIATVHGDVHDIGKNIVKVLLENYGFDVVDLGKDVPPENILKRCEQNDIRIVALSALMTTTVKNMEKTIKLVREKFPQIKIFVGGAVLTEDYAMKIGADDYALDARAAIRIAQKHIKNN